MGKVGTSRKGVGCEPIEKRFFARLIKGAPDACWGWRGRAKACGYPVLSCNGKNRRVSQVSWEIHHGMPFPEGKMACHTCDNPACVNPNHIWPGTMRDNMRDCMAKGRFRVNYSGSPKKNLTHCLRGHEYTPENTIIKKSGRTACRACRVIHNRNYKRARAALAPPPALKGD